MSKSIIAEGYVITQDFIRFLEETIEDWILIIPEANDYLWTTRHFLNIIKVDTFLVTSNVRMVDQIKASIKSLKRKSVLHDAQITPRPSIHRSNTSLTRKQDRLNSWINQPIEYYQTHRLKLLQSGNILEP